jgi:predicted amidohydrolase YtcJ
VLLVNGRTPEPVALRVERGRVVECGPRLEPQHGEQVLDLGGRVVRRGLRDAHAHVVEWARSQREVDLSGAGSAAAAADLVASAHRAAPPGAVVRGSFFRDALWPDEPAAALLDRAAPGRVVVLRSLDMHSVWLSPATLAVCGLPDHPTGLLREHEAWAALDRLPARAAAEDDAAVDVAVGAAHQRGLTSVRDFSFEDAHGSWSRRQASRGGTLPLRVTAVVQPVAVPGLVERGLSSGSGDDWLRIGPLKLFVDGALGARTARCLTPYAGGSDRGRQLLDPQALRTALEGARLAGLDVAVHAIGDEATRDALQALQTAGVGASLEHAQLLRTEDLPLFRSGGVVASIQPAHLVDDAPLVDDLWRHTTSLPYAVRSLVSAGATIVLGSDAPVSPLDPWVSIAAAVHRTVGVDPPWRAGEAVDLELALVASGARRVAVGDRADLVVVDAPDLAALSAADLAQVPVHATFLAGQCVHGPWRD